MRIVIKSTGLVLGLAAISILVFTVFLMVSATVEGASGTRVVITVHTIEALDELEGLGDDPDMVVLAWVDGERVIEEGPFDNDAHVVVDAVHAFRTLKSSFELKLRVYDVDPFDNDELDVSGEPGGGQDDYETGNRGATFVAIFNVGYGTLEGDPYDVRGDWWATSGELDGSTGSDENDGEVLFMVETNEEPELISSSPDEGSITIEEGKQQTFTVGAADPEGDPISMVWFIDDHAHEGLGQWFTVDAPVGSAGEYTVACEVYEGACPDPSITVWWTLTVVEYNFPPVAVLEGPSEGDLYETLVFSAEGSYDRDSHDITYEWTVDGEEAGTLERLYAFFTTPGTHEVALTVSDGEKEDGRTMTVTIADIAMPDPLMEVINRGQVDVVTDYEYDLRSTNSWGIMVTECEDYAYYLELGLWFEFQMEHDGSAELTLQVADMTTPDIDLAITLDFSDDTYSVKFRPTLYVEIEKRYFDGRSAETYIRAPLPLPSMTDADGDGSFVPVGGYNIYLWDSWVEIYSLDAANSFGDAFDYEFTATLASVDLMRLVQEVAKGDPGVSLVLAILDIFVDVELQFNLNVDLWFSEDLYVFRNLEREDGRAVLNLYSPREGSNVDMVTGLAQGATVHSAVHSYMDTEVYGSLDLVVTLDFSSIWDDFVSFLFGEETKEYRYTLLQTGSLEGSSQGFTLTDAAWTIRRAPLEEPVPTVNEVTESQMTVAWVKSPKEIVEEYRVYIKKGETPLVGIDEPVAVVPGTQYRATLTDLDPGTEYYLAVMAVGKDGSHKLSTAVTFQTAEAEDEGGFLADNAMAIGGVVLALIVVMVAFAIVMGRRRRAVAVDTPSEEAMPPEPDGPSEEPSVEAPSGPEPPMAPQVPEEGPVEELRQEPTPALMDARNGIGSVTEGPVPASIPQEMAAEEPVHVGDGLAKFCPECGTPFTGDSRFCAECGQMRGAQ